MLGYGKKDYFFPWLNKGELGEERLKKCRSQSKEWGNCVINDKAHGLPMLTPLIIVSLFSSNVLTCDLKMNQFKHKPLVMIIAK